MKNEEKTNAEFEVMAELSRKKHIIMWVLFFIGIIAIAVFIFKILLILKISFLISMIVSVLFFLLVSLITIFTAWFQVLEKTEVITEVYGKYYGKPFLSGIHLFFPWFGIFNVKMVVSLAQQMMELKLADKKENTESNSGGDIEFIDGSASILSYFYFEVEDTYKAVYNAEHIKRFIQEMVESSLRIFLGTYTIDEAISLKAEFTLEAIILGKNVMSQIKKTLTEDSNFKNDYLELNKKITEIAHENFKKSEFYLFLKNWGIIPKALFISDMKLSDKVKEQRSLKLEAEKNYEVAEINVKTAKAEKKSAIIRAEALQESRKLEGQGEKEFHRLQGEGYAEKIKSLVSRGISEKDATNIIKADIKWNGIEGAGDKTIIIENDSNELTSSGAKFGAGFKVSENKKNK